MKFPGKTVSVCLRPHPHFSRSGTKKKQTYADAEYCFYLIHLYPLKDRLFGSGYFLFLAGQPTANSF
jgi:hypothetical protein